MTKLTYEQLETKLASIIQEAETNQKWAFLEWRSRAEELLAERDVMAKDAARYQWLRLNYDDSLVMAGGDKGCAELYMEEELDKAIDSAMKGTPT